MVRYILSTLLICCFLSGYAQKNNFTPPNYKKIHKEINQPGSKPTYQQLFKRYNDNDTTLSPEEYRLLYFGFTFQPEYSPDVKEPMVDSLMAILRLEQIKPEQYDKVVKYSEKILQKNPFDMRYLDPLIYVYRMQGNNQLASKLEFKLGRIIETIFTTGDGLTEKTAFHVISATHETDMLRALGFGFVGMQSIKNNQFDYLKVEENAYGIEGIYFKKPTQ